MLGWVIQVNFNRDKSSLISITEQVILYKGTEYIA